MSTSRLVHRYKAAFEHPSEEERKEYLKQHPKADPKNHTVKPQGKQAPGEEDDSEESPHADPTEKGEKPGKGKGFFKGLSEKAKAFVTKSTAAVQKFVSDTEHRARVLEDAGKAVLASPKTYAKRVVQTVKEEVHEFKEAGQALKLLSAGKELNHHQKKALKTVAIHMGIAIAAAALTSTGLLAGAAAFGKGMVQKIALKAAAHTLGNIHMLEEIHHIGHGAGHLLHLVASEQDEQDVEEAGTEEETEQPEAEPETDEVDESDEDEGEDASPEEALAFLVMQSVVKAMKELGDEDMSEILEEASGDQEKLAFKVGAALESDLPALLVEGQNLFRRLQGWISRFDSVLISSRAESEGLDGRVWQKRFVSYFKDGEGTLEDLRGLDQSLDDLFLEVPTLAQVANFARQAVRIPRHAEIAYAISDIDFFPTEGGRDGITYNPDVLREWAGAVKGWATKGEAQLKALESKASRLLSA
jgi:hypothetical protein